MVLAGSVLSESSESAPIAQFMASELDKAVEEKEKELEEKEKGLEEERRTRVELADITERVTLDMEVHMRSLRPALSLPSSPPPPHTHAAQLVWRARIRRERCDGRERRPRSPPRQRVNGKRASRRMMRWDADSALPAGASGAASQQTDLASKEEKIKELRVQIALADSRDDGQLLDEIAGLQTENKNLKKQLAKEKKLRISAQVRACVWACVAV